MLRRHARPCALSAAAAAPLPAYGQVRCQRRSGPGRAGGGWEAGRGDAVAVARTCVCGEVRSGAVPRGGGHAARRTSSMWIN